MLLYHASYQVFTPAQIVAATKDCLQYPDVVGALEAKRPAHTPSRKVCLFATDSPESAAAFLASQAGPVPLEAELRVYEVGMAFAHRAPFRLVHEISKRLKAGTTFDALVQAYWEPSPPWAFWETFGPSFEVIAEIPSVSEAGIIRFKRAYDADIARSRAM